MTNVGFKIDIKNLKKLSKSFNEKAKELEKKVYQIAGEKFNLKSTQQLSIILFEKLSLPIKGLKKTPKGVISTKESELQKLKGEHKIIDLILEYRELTKMISTYVDNLILMVDVKERLHPEFLQLGTSTGRMSSKNPNNQIQRKWFQGNLIPVHLYRNRRQINKLFVTVQMSIGYSAGSWNRLNSG